MFLLKCFLVNACKGGISPGGVVRKKRMQRFGLTTDRTAPNPTCPPLPMVHFENPLIINVLHASAKRWGLSPSYCHACDFLSQSRKERKARKWHIVPTKTRKTLAVMQGLRPLFLSGTVVFRIKLRPAGTGKKQPSFLRLASRQGKPEKPLTPRGIATPAWNILAAHSHIMLNNHATC